MGQNCIRYLEDILKEKSLTVSCNTLFNGFTDLNFKGVCLNDNSRFSDWKELTEKQIYWLDRSPERNLPDGWE